MQRKTIKLSVILLALSLVISMLAGCGANKQAGEGNTGNGTTNEGGEQAAEDLSPITFSFFAEDPSPNWNNMQDEVSKVLTEKTGVTLNAEFAVGDPAQKVALIAASGNYPDLISAKGDIGKLVDAGAMLDLTDLIEQHAPNIKKLFGDQMARLKYSNDDQSIYVIPTWSTVDGINFKAGGGFELQHRAVKEAGYPAIRTVQDFENVIKNYLEKHPTDENGNKNIGLSLNADDWHMYISVTNPAVFATGGPDDGEYFIDPETQKVIYHFRRPVEKEYFRWLNHMNAEGLLDPESFVQKYDQYKAKVASGRVIGLVDQDWDYADGENALKSAGKYDQAYGHYPVTLTEEYKDHSFQRTGFEGGWGVGITTDCADPVRAIKFLDYLASEEGQILLNWGIEGKHYNVENGVRVIPKEIQDRKANDAANFQREVGIGLYWNVGAHYGDGVKDSTGNYFTTNFPEQILVSYNDVEKETMAAYGVQNWKELFPQEDEFPIKPWGAAWNLSVPGDSELAVLQEKMKEITWKKIPEAILAKPEQFDAIWDDYQAQLIKAGVEKMEAEYQKLVDARLELWSAEQK